MSAACRTLESVLPWKLAVDVCDVTIHSLTDDFALQLVPLFVGFVVLPGILFLFLGQLRAFRVKKGFPERSNETVVPLAQKPPTEKKKVVHDDSDLNRYYVKCPAGNLAPRP